MKKGKTLATFIDLQNDFALPGSPLYVPKGEEAARNSANFVNKNGSEIDDLLNSLDSHQEVHIAQCITYVDKNGNHPDPFTKISVEDVKNGTIRAFAPVYQSWIEEYVEKLEQNGSYELQLWPTHCKVGTPGHNFYDSFGDAVYSWERDNYARANMIPKGNNPLVEHYSVFQADVQTDDVTTQPNSQIIDIFNEFGGEDDRILLGGLAFNFCLFSSVRDFIEYFGDDYAKRFILFEDCTAAIEGGEFDELTENATKYLKDKGVTFMNSTDY